MDNKDSNDNFFDKYNDEIDENDVLKEFDRIYESDKALQQMLGDCENYNIEEKLSIVQAYKRGGGIAGLNDIIDDEGENEDDDNLLGGAQGGQGDRLDQQRTSFNGNGD